MSYYPLPERCRAFIERLQAFVRPLNAHMSVDEVYDLAGHLYIDALGNLQTEVTPWHQVRWGQAVSHNPEYLTLGRSKADALETVLEFAKANEQNLDPIREADAETLALTLNGQLYATIEPVRYTEPSAESHERIKTLLAGINTNNEYLLVQRLRKLPAWELEPFQSLYAGWRPDAGCPVDWPSTGEGLRRLSTTHGPNPAPADVDLSDAERAQLVELNPHPMWPTPSAIAKLFHAKLRPRVDGGLKLAQCQEALAKLYAFNSWSSFIARFNKEVFPQVLVRTVDTETDKSIDAPWPSYEFLCYRTPAQLLAGVYDNALSRKHAGHQKPYVSVCWRHEDRLQLGLRDRSWQSIREELAASALATPPTMPQDAEGEARTDAWLARQSQLRVRANEWRTVSRSYFMSA